MINSRRFFSSSQKKRRRKAPRELSLTKKERIRLHKERPSDYEIPTGGVFVSREEAGEVLESRLTQARDFVYNFWSSGGPRPERRGPTMDARWWFWNICLALMPATLIGLYCEFVVEPEMNEFFRQQNEMQQRRIMGDEHAEEYNIPPPPSVIEEPVPVVQHGFGQKAKEAVRELANLSSGPAPSPSQSHQTEQVPSTSNLAKESTAQVSSTPESQQTVSSAVDSREPVSDRDLLLSLRRRVDELEAELQKQHRQRVQREKYQRERMQQSGIQNRVEDQMVHEWETQRLQQSSSTGSANAENDNDDKTLSDKVKNAAWAGLRQNISDKKEAMERYGIDIMDRAWGFWDDTDKEEDASVEKVDSVNESKKAEPTKSAAISTRHDEVVKSVQETAKFVNQAADAVASSVSADATTASQRAVEAAEAAVEAAEAAEVATEAADAARQAAASVPTQSSGGDSWWRSILQRKCPDSDSAVDEGRKS